MWRQASPALDGPLVAATRWWEALLFGGIGTSLAIISIAILGMLMLGGRLPLRRGGGAILGCFILFGAPTIVRGLMAGFEAATVIEPRTPEPLAAESRIIDNTISPPPAQPAYDPYAGAAVPVN